MIFFLSALNKLEMDDPEEVKEYFEDMQLYFERQRELRAQQATAWRKRYRRQSQVLDNHGSVAARVHGDGSHLAADSEHKDVGDLG
jgi:hypothetical protein